MNGAGGQGRRGWKKEMPCGSICRQLERWSRGSGGARDPANSLASILIVLPLPKKTKRKRAYERFPKHVHKTGKGKMGAPIRARVGFFKRGRCITRWVTYLLQWHSRDGILQLYFLARGQCYRPSVDRRLFIVICLIPRTPILRGNGELGEMR